MKAKSQGKNGEIEFLRFLFAALVVLHHSKHLSPAYGLMKTGAFCVEFFFILSGYFLMHTIGKHQGSIRDANQLAKESLRIVFRKIRGFYTELFVGYMIGLCFVLATSAYSLKHTVFDIVKAVTADLLLLEMFGLGHTSINRSLWYLSTMVFCLLILVPLLLKWPKWMGCYVLPIAASLLLCYIWKIDSAGSIFSPRKILLFTYKGNIRGFVDLSIGVALYYPVQYLKNMRISLPGRVLLTITKWISYAAVLIWMQFFGQKAYQPMVILLLLIGMAVSLGQQGVDSALYDNRFCFFLGRVSLPLYVTHYFFGSALPDLASLNNVMPDADLRLKLVVYLLLAFGTALLNMWISDWLRKQHIADRFIKTVTV